MSARTSRFVIIVAALRSPFHKLILVGNDVTTINVENDVPSATSKRCMENNFV